MLLLDVTVLGRHDPSLWNNRGHCLPSAFRGHQSSFSELFIAANSASLACKAARQVELSRAGEGDAFQVLVVLDKLSGNNLFLISAFLSHDD